MNPQADVVDFTEGKTVLCNLVSTEQLWRRLRPIHAVQGYAVNWGEPTTSTEACEPWYVDATKGG